MSVDSTGLKGRWERPDYFPGCPLSRQNVFLGFRGALILCDVLRQHAAVLAHPIPLNLWDDPEWENFERFSPSSANPSSSSCCTPSPFVRIFVRTKTSYPARPPNVLSVFPPPGVPATTWAAAASTRAPAAPRPAATGASAAPSPTATPLISDACAAWASATGCV